MAKKTAKEIVAEALPEMEIVEPATPAAPAASATADTARGGTRPGPSMAELRKKYLGTDAAEDDADEVEPAEGDEADIEVVQVRPKKTPADPAEDPGKRTLIISKKKGIIGSQG